MTAPRRSIHLAPDEGRHVTLEEYWDKWYENPYPDIDVSYEWNNGILEAKFPWPTRRNSILDSGSLPFSISMSKRTTIAKLINMETGFVLTMEDAAEPSGIRKAVRKPDIGIILNNNPVSWGRVDQRSFAGVCDAVVEFLSDSTQAEVLRDTEEKKRDYALAGVQEYYILDPTGEHMHFYRLTPESRYDEIQPDAGEVIRSQLLPGFQFRLRDLDELPELEELALDEVYRGYVLLKYQASVSAAAAEATARQHAEAAAAADAAARQQAEQLAANAPKQPKRPPASKQSDRPQPKRPPASKQSSEPIPKQPPADRPRSSCKRWQPNWPVCAGGPPERNLPKPLSPPARR